MRSLSVQLSSEAVPLYVDLDGTLLATDTLWDSPSPDKEESIHDILSASLAGGWQSDL